MLILPTVSEDKPLKDKYKWNKQAKSYPQRMLILNVCTYEMQT